MRLALLASSVLVACTTAVSAPSTTPPTTETAPTVTSTTYPVSYPVFDEAELSRRTAAAEALTPEWHITLDSLGFLSSARRGSPADPTIPYAEEHAKVVEFLEKQRAITGLDGPNIKKAYDYKRAALYQQTASSGTIAHLLVSYSMPPASISGHLWPLLPPDGPSKPDAELEAKVKALDPTPDLTMQHGYRYTAPSNQGPLTIHETLCGHLPVDAVTDQKLRPQRPCIDVRTGEDLTAQLVRMLVKSTNNVVTERKLAP